MITSSQAISGANGLLRVVAAILGRRAIPHKNLHSKIVMRGIASEIPSEAPLKIVDTTGKSHRGVYVLNVLIWNRGNQEMTPADFMDGSPLRLAMGETGYVISAHVISNDDQLKCSTAQEGDKHVDVYFDCIKPRDYLNVVLFYGGSSYADLQVLGRIHDQDVPLDHMAEEVHAGWAKKFMTLIALSVYALMVFGFPLSTWHILNEYGFSRLLRWEPDIPKPILSIFLLSAGLVFAQILNIIERKLERRKYPPGYPLRSDFEPPFWENIKGLCETAFQGKKRRFSVSMFERAKPIIMLRKNNRRRTVQDWIS